MRRGTSNTPASLKIESKHELIKSISEGDVFTVFEFEMKTSNDTNTISHAVYTQIAH